MQFSTTTIALCLNIILAAALPEPRNVGMVQRLDTRAAVSGDLIFSRSFDCAANDPTVCCACRGGFGTCVNGSCSCNDGDC